MTLEARFVYLFEGTASETNKFLRVIFPEPLNKMVLNGLNSYRKNHYIDTMVVPSVLYEQITVKN